MFERTLPTRAETCLPTADLTGDIALFTRRLGFRLDAIHPADDPAVAVLSGHGLRLRLDRAQAGAAGTLRILTDEAAIARGEDRLTTPGGTTVLFDVADPPLVLPPTLHTFAVHRLAEGAPWVVGRAGMEYRDLIPGRLGGAMIASHIRIPQGGPVPDMVHYHKVGFQLIYCLAGWVDVLYEDQGGLRRLTPGDCFTQPPGIRHRVVEASDGIEVIEIAVPAAHETIIDHDLQLPTPDLRPDRAWDGQRFVHHRAAGAPLHPHRIPGYLARDTGISAATGARADVQVLRPNPAQRPAPFAHDADILFAHVIAGGLTLAAAGRDPFALTAGDAFVIPPGLSVTFAGPAPDLELLLVTLAPH